MAASQSIAVGFEIRHANRNIVDNLRSQVDQVEGKLDRIEPPVSQGIMPAPFPEVIQILTHVAGAGAGIALLKGLKDIIVTWIKARAGREIAVSVGNKKIKVRGSVDMDELIAALEKMPEPAKAEKASKAKSTSRKAPATKGTSVASATSRSAKGAKGKPRAKQTLE